MLDPHAYNQPCSALPFQQLCPVLKTSSCMTVMHDDIPCSYHSRVLSRRLGRGPNNHSAGCRWPQSWGSGQFCRHFADGHWGEDSAASLSSVESRQAGSSPSAAQPKLQVSFMCGPQPSAGQGRAVCAVRGSSIGTNSAEVRCAGQGRTGYLRAGQGRAGQGRAGQGRAGQGRVGQGRARQGRAGQG